MDIVLRGVQPEEITLQPSRANAAGGRGAMSVESLFREHYARIVSMLARLTGDRAHAEEVAADVFHKLSQRLELLAGHDDPTAWIYRVATNAGLDAIRTNSRRRKREEIAGQDVCAAAPPDALDHLLREERRARVREVLEELKPREAQLLRE